VQRLKYKRSLLSAPWEQGWWEALHTMTQGYRISVQPKTFSPSMVFCHLPPANVKVRIHVDFHHFPSYPLEKMLNVRMHLSAREAGRCSLAVCTKGGINFGRQLMASTS
jgi:hypothetical protein